MKYKGAHSDKFNYITKNYKFRFNVVTNFYEYKHKGKKKKKWIKYDDRVKNSILIELMSEGMDFASTKFDTFIESPGISPDYNPFKEYFNELEKWNGKKDHIAKMAKTIDTDTPKRFKDTFERFLVGCIDCLLLDDNVNDVCLVFQGAQGTGKSRWMRALLPKRFQSEYLYEGNIDTKNKDHTMYLSQYWFIHLDELETLRSNDIAAIKSFITRQRISVRKAYGRHKSTFVRRASFLGSVNEDKFLSDITGNRRWLVFKVNNVDYLHTLNPDKVWSQAYALWKKGYRHWFDINEIKEINEHNEQFRTISLEEELFLRLFEVPKEGKSGEFLSSTEVIVKVVRNSPQFTSKMHSILMGKALSKHATTKKRSGGLTKYLVNYIGIDEPLAEEGITPVTSQQRDAMSNEPIGEDDDLPF